jgi:hypothetical protein
VTVVRGRTNKVEPDSVTPPVGGAFEACLEEAGETIVHEWLPMRERTNMGPFQREISTADP